MGVAVKPGGQECWYFGGTFDGLNKAYSGGFKFGPTFDFLFAQNSNAASFCFGKDTATANLHATFNASATSYGSNTSKATVLNGGANPVIGGQKNWIFGLTDYGLLKKDPGTQSYWLFGTTDGSLFNLNKQSAVSFGVDRITANLHATFNASATSYGSNTSKATVLNGGATYNYNKKKCFHYGLSFFGVTPYTVGANSRNSLINAQSLWFYGLPEPDTFPTITFDAAIDTYPKIVSARMRRKNILSASYPSRKIVSADIQERNDPKAS